MRRVLVWAALAVPLAGGPFQDARAGCREVAKPLVEALAARDLEGARRHYDAVYKEFGCPDEYREQAARAVAKLHEQVAVERMAGGASLASQRALLEQGASYGGTWLIHALRGDIAHDAQEYDRAAKLFQGALVAINDEVQTPRAPPDSDIDRIRRLAEQSRMLATRYVETPTDREGEPDGLSAPAIRGFKPEATVLPITFEFDSAEFDALGRRYAEELAEALKRQETSGPVTISAHTDASGPAAYNLELSRRRGEAVRRFLEAQGIERELVVLAKGESEPLDLLQSEGYGQKEIDRLNRRVQWLR